MSNQPYIVPPEQQTWVQRNWKLAATLGCLTFVVLAVGFIATVFYLISAAVRSSTPFKEAVARAQSNPAVIEQLGSPVRSSWIVSGSVNVNGPSGKAELAIPIHGPKAKGNLYVTATKSAEQWTYSTMIADTGKERIDLRSPDEKGPN